MIRRITTGALALLASLALGGAAQAIPIIELDGYTIAAAPGQQIQIFVSGGASVSGLSFGLQVGDGGLINGGSDDGPLITLVDLVTGTIFEANNGGQNDLNPLPDLLAFSSITTAAGSLVADGLLATVTFDGTGFGGRSLSLHLTGVAGTDTTFVDDLGFEIAAQIANGTITVTTAVPEPVTSALALGAFGALAGAARRRRQRSASRG
jgi:hypothetical protein